MRTYTWDEYYEKFYDWAESTRIKNITYLESLGDSDEVTEILIELKDNKNAANRLLKKSIDANIKFSGDNLNDLFFWDFDKEMLMQILWDSADNLTTEDIEALYITVDDEDLLKVCEKGHISLPDELKDFECEEDEETYEEEYFQEEFNEHDNHKSKKIGFLGHTFAILAAMASVSKNNKNKKHSGRCDGDCMNCPSHYGYRHGRWYYGKGHMHGCQFGGNRGDGRF